MRTDEELEAFSYFVVCRQCDPFMQDFVGFHIPEEREQWQAEHYREMGHDHWLVVNREAE